MVSGRKMEKEGQIREVYAALIAIVIIVAGSAAIMAESTGVSSSSGNVNITLSDGSDVDKYTYCGEYCAQKGKPVSTLWDISFYSNFTNSTGKALNSTVGDGECKIQLNSSSHLTSWYDMAFNSTQQRYVYNASSNYKGVLNYTVNCTSMDGNITYSKAFEIQNTQPYILTTPSGFIDFNGDSVKDYLQCTEDTVCTYNFSANVSEDDWNDVLVFNYSASSNTTLTNFTLNTSTGILVINVTTNIYSGQRRVELNVKDEESTIKSALLEVNISSFNDFPVFANLTNKSFNATEAFEYVVLVSDEENDKPYTFNITFMNCSVAQWSTRDCTTSEGRELFNSTQYSADGSTGILNISFAPTRNDVGNYTINFTVTDLNNNINPKNASTSMIITFSVTNINLAPYFTYVCNNENSTVENQTTFCYINVTDIDETSNLTIFANYSWFKFNSSDSNLSLISVNSSTGFNGSALVNFTSEDINVGNWSVNITVLDTGIPIRVNSTVLQFYVANLNDSVSLAGIDDISPAYNTNVYIVTLNATDNDLLVPDINVFRENLTFASNYSWVYLRSKSTANNRTVATFAVNASEASAGTDYKVRINVTDVSGNLAYADFMVNVSGNNPPVWNSSVNSTFEVTEKVLFYYNFSLYAYDEDLSSMNFTYGLGNDFSSFALTQLGISSFTPDDFDVGAHTVTLNASDGITNSSRAFNFNVNNVNDAPYIRQIISPYLINASVSSGTVTAAEDNYTIIYFYVDDNDFVIPTAQREFYDESLNLSVDFEGVNPALFEVYLASAPAPGSNLSLYSAAFTPAKSSVGQYNVSVNVTDSSLASFVLNFNLTIVEVQHGPVINTISNINSSILGAVYLDINSTDSEDGGELTAGNNLTYRIINLTQGGNFLTINSTSGIINFSFNQSHAGRWEYRVIVNDSSNFNATTEFNVTVYDYPLFLSPLSSASYGMQENSSIILNFSVNHTVQDSLNYTLYVNGIIRNSTTGNGNASSFLWLFTPNFTDETTCSGAVNLTLNVSNAYLSNSTSWSTVINHTNYPLAFISNIGGASQELSGGSSVSITLSNYFMDTDASDRCVNQTVRFISRVINASQGEVSVTVTDWVNGTTPGATFSAAVDSSANYSMIAVEYNLSNSSEQISNVTSNNFSVTLVPPDPVVTPTPTGGGGSSTTIPVMLKLVLPDPVSAKRKDRLVMPIKLLNSGEKTLNGIHLFSTVAKNGSLRRDVSSVFDRDFIEKLDPGQTADVNLIANIDTEEFGLYEISVNATVDDPVYSDWGKIFLNVKEGTRFEEKLIFTEELLVQNPACAELKELIDQAKEYARKGETAKAEETLAKTIQACQSAISQKTERTKVADNVPAQIFSYVGAATLIVLLMGFAYYLYRRSRIQRILSGY